jgi:hypothetical protein
MDLIQFQQNLLSIDVWELLKPIINQHLEYVEQLNKEQLSQGLLADGNDTPSHSGSEMSNDYVASKIDRGVYPESLYPNMNFYNEGDFYKGITAFLEDDGITIDSDDEKAMMLEGEYSQYLMGLTQESLAKFTARLVTPLIESIHNEIFKA